MDTTAYTGTERRKAKRSDTNSIFQRRQRKVALAMFHVANKLTITSLLENITEGMNKTDANKVDLLITNLSLLDERVATIKDQQRRLVQELNITCHEIFSEQTKNRR